jgi:hypothetical protein
MNPSEGYRNGYEDRQVQTAEGTLHLKMPQVGDTIEAFESAWLRALVRGRQTGSPHPAALR